MKSYLLFRRMHKIFCAKVSKKGYRRNILKKKNMTNFKKKECMGTFFYVALFNIVEDLSNGEHYVFIHRVLIL